MHTLCAASSHVFSVPPALRRAYKHIMSSDTGSKPYICVVCDKGYPRKSVCPFSGSTIHLVAMSIRDALLRHSKHHSQLDSTVAQPKASTSHKPLSQPIHITPQATYAVDLSESTPIENGMIESMNSTASSSTDPTTSQDQVFAPLLLNNIVDGSNLNGTVQRPNVDLFPTLSPNWDPFLFSLEPNFRPDLLSGVSEVQNVFSDWLSGKITLHALQIILKDSCKTLGPTVTEPVFPFNPAQNDTFRVYPASLAQELDAIAEVFRALRQSSTVLPY